MNKAKKISLLFFLIFLFGLIGFIASINLSLNKKSQVHIKSAQLYMEKTISTTDYSLYY
ncbi:hypothetical protein [Salegentibacter salegens]|uniref:hypothetical protein n=1 Tax=Salegentibacter salegens TaxID=143223 RepID=UPI000D45BFA1|nr:hypothetical protein [Salegentibacter salegens]PRX51598.1 hypothetical protein LY58_00673 [Salegentibacter salegens]